MNKTFSRLCATILTFQALYIIVFFFPMIPRLIASTESNGMAITGVTSIVIAVILLLIAGLGLFWLKRWTMALLWASLLVACILSVVIGHSLPSYVYGGFDAWVIDLIIAIFLTLEWKKTRVLK